MPATGGSKPNNYLSRKSRERSGNAEETFLGEDREWLLQYSKEMLKKKEINFFVFGHRHLPIDYRLTEKSRYINLGDWVNFYTYAVFDGENMELKSFNGRDEKIVRNW